VLAAVYAVAIGGVALHGLVLWDDPLQRAAALLVTLLAAAMTVGMARGGSFAPRATIELRHDDQDDSARFAVVAGGRLVAAEVGLSYDDGELLMGAGGEIERFSALRSLSVAPDPAPGGELKVWAHRVSADEQSEPLDVRVRRAGGAVTMTFPARGGPT
jgi:hypothetical protein